MPRKSNDVADGISRWPRPLIPTCIHHAIPSSQLQEPELEIGGTILEDMFAGLAVVLSQGCTIHAGNLLRRLAIEVRRALETDRTCNLSDAEDAIAES